MTDFDLFLSRPRRGLVSFLLLLESFSFLDVDSFSFLGDKDSFSFLGELDSFSFLGESFYDPFAVVLGARAICCPVSYSHH